MGLFQMKALFSLVTRLSEQPAALPVGQWRGTDALDSDFRVQFKLQSANKMRWLEHRGSSSLKFCKPVNRAWQVVSSLCLTVGLGGLSGPV
jgi:hypothetical protein